MMQQMPELVENGLHLTMREQRWTIAHRRSKVTANESSMRLEAIAERDAGDEGVHPRTTPLVFPWEPVCVKCPDQRVVRRTALIVNLIVLDLGVPHWNSWLLHHANTVQPLHDLEHSLHHALERKKRPQRFFIEIIERGPLFFRIVSDVPRIEFGSAREGRQLLVFLLKVRIRFGFEIG